jgi:hypothetical protein
MSTNYEAPHNNLINLIIPKHSIQSPAMCLLVMWSILFPPVSYSNLFQYEQTLARTTYS